MDGTGEDMMTKLLTNSVVYGHNAKECKYVPGGDVYNNVCCYTPFFYPKADADLAREWKISCDAQAGRLMEHVRR